jgi:hypothetical protein
MGRGGSTRKIPLMTGGKIRNFSTRILTRAFLPNRMLKGPEFYEFKMTRNSDAMTLSEEQVY